MALIRPSLSALQPGAVEVFMERILWNRVAPRISEWRFFGSDFSYAYSAPGSDQAHNSGALAPVSVCSSSGSGFQTAAVQPQGARSRAINLRFGPHPKPRPKEIAPKGAPQGLALIVAFAQVQARPPESPWWPSAL